MLYHCLLLAVVAIHSVDGFNSALNKLPELKLAEQPTHVKIDCNTTGCEQNGYCLNCTFPADCVYGQTVELNCYILKHECKFSDPSKPVNSAVRTPEAVCRYCYQTQPWEHQCFPIHPINRAQLRSGDRIAGVCAVLPHVLCLGNRMFYKRIQYQYTSGHRWSIAMLFSVTLGGFGADRFYLGLWKSGVGKLFSFGGLGIWTLIDVVLIGTGYVGPADGSVYIY